MWQLPSAFLLGHREPQRVPQLPLAEIPELLMQSVFWTWHQELGWLVFLRLPELALAHPERVPFARSPFRFVP
jgi:hypothetical protein